MPYPIRSVAYTRAKRAGRDDVARMLLLGGPKTNPTAAESARENEYASDSVGERCTQARGRDRYRLDRLLHDKDYRVIRILLNNPMVVERDVVKIAAMRPTRPDVLAEVAQHRRWASRYAVKRRSAPILTRRPSRAGCCRRCSDRTWSRSPRRAASPRRFALRPRNCCGATSPGLARPQRRPLRHPQPD